MEALYPRGKATIATEQEFALTPQPLGMFTKNAKTSLPCCESNSKFLDFEAS
jgi:hypothetical protein